MIARLFGEILEITEESCVLCCAGVGYELHCAVPTLAQIQEHKNKTIALHVYTHVREDALQLFGFISAAEKGMFLALLKVNGIGPKSAMNILSGSSLQQLTQMISDSDVQGLSKLPKVGKKTAEQMILTLKGKLAESSGVSFAGPLAPSLQSQVSSALIHLGFRIQDIDKVVPQLEFPTVEEGVRQALGHLSQL